MFTSTYSNGYTYVVRTIACGERMNLRGVLILMVVVTCSAVYPPTDSSWARVPTNPVLRPTEPWEGLTHGTPCVCENVALFDASAHEFVMFYRGGWGTTAVGRATSPDGVTWTKYPGNPVFGRAEGEDGGQPYVFHESDSLAGPLWMHTTNNGNPAPHVLIATSQDRGLSWVRQNASVPLPPQASGFGNRVVWREGYQWLMLQEVLAGPWQIYLYNSSDGHTWSVLNSGEPLSSLQLHPQGMYGGPRFANVDGRITPRWADGLYHLWYHAVNGTGDLPTDIYHATSADLHVWHVTAGAVVHHLGTGFEFDQVMLPSPSN